MYVDSHCHLHLMDESSGMKEADVVQEALDAQVVHLLCVSTHPDQKEVLEGIRSRHACVSISLGLHPNEEIEKEPDLQTWLKIAENQTIVSIGETGLDYYRSTGDLEWQRERFRVQIALAKRLKKPLIIHTREAKTDTVRILKEENAGEVGGVLHCFTEDWEMAKACMDLNFAISFSGIVTFKNAKELQEVAKKVPLESMLIETDAPYLAPMPHRGKPNRPAYLPHVAEFIAGIKNVPVSEVATQTTKNFAELFGVAIEI